MHPIVQSLSCAVLKRMGSPAEMGCRIFSSKDAGARCLNYIQEQHSPDAQTEVVSVWLPGEDNAEISHWARFCAVIYPCDAEKTIVKFWAIFGDGLSSRHAEFCLDQLRFMTFESQSYRSKPQSYCLESHAEINPLAVPSWVGKGQIAKNELRSRIATLIGSEHADLSVISSSDVFLYDKGMCALFAVARALLPEKDDERKSGIVVYG
jgi:cystathionine gamma-synthase